ncbi:MAG: AMP-binding protein [Proteobacteria bacterium]|nr:AMP-binding protein [Pseudomonadota bacterium]MBU1581161.1 AMP-binding protein [Pseudomonadota bacterium]MBU2454849.1 AMP-binding protein [Pseudomonadota bacterium]MBU2629975.1 AMP-binding protein [Pseudomonadota bacterium]
MATESMNILIEKRFKTFAHKKAITFYRDGNIETQLTFDDLKKDILLFKNFLAVYRLKKGDRVILLLEKSVIAVIAHFALLMAGLIAVPLNPGFKRNELEYLINDAGAGLIMVNPGKKEMIKAICPEMEILEISTHLPYEKIDFFRSAVVSSSDIPVSQKDPALIIYTSGTTGKPKGAVLTHGNLVCDAKNIMSIWELSSEDVLCHALPLFHVHGLCFALHTALLSGSHVLLLDAFKPQTVLQNLSSKHPSHICSTFMAVPAMYTRLMDYIGDQKIDFSHLRLLTSGSAPLLEKEFERIKTIFGKDPVEREGMSETGMNFSNPLKGRKIPGSIGRPLPGVGVRIMDIKTKKDVKPGAVGEIWLKSPSITKGYWQKTMETKAAFKQGWFKTGDLGRMDKDGYYYLTDRIKHLIITGGENVSATEVERVINSIDGVKESSVVGVADEVWGEKVVALVEKIPGIELSELKIQSICKEMLHNLKCPKKILFTNHIPKNTMGKVLKEKVKNFFN